MHNKPVAVYERNVVDEVLAVSRRARRSGRVRRGMRAEHVILDPGIGFGKTARTQSRGARARSTALVALGFPTLLGTSRKSTIGKLTGRQPVDERAFGTAATLALAVAAGIDIVRVHDVAEARDVVARHRRDRARLAAGRLDGALP